MTHSHPQSRSHQQYSSYHSHGVTDASRDFAPPRRVTRAAARSPRPAHPSIKQPVLPQTPPGYPPTHAALPPVQAPHAYPSSPPMRRRPRKAFRAERRSPRNVLLAGGSMLAVAALVVGPKPIVDRAAERSANTVVCQETVQAQSVLSRSELSELLAIDERAPKGDVRAVIEEPYCTLSAVEVREGVTAQREAYPLEFNPETWFIVLYEGEEYAGFDFSFSRD